MDAPQSEVYTTKESVLALFDLRVSGTAERLHQERAAWAENADIEALDEHHYVLIVLAGGAREIAR